MPSSPRGMGNLLSPAEKLELQGLEALPSPTVAEQERINALREKAARGPLKALLTVFAGELAAMEENLAQLYDDQFIETCADWAIPYIGDLIGYEPLHALGQARGLARAEVAHTIALRRRKGTAAVLEQLARDVTGWNARAVEYFQLLGWTQYMNHIRPRSFYAPDMRRWEPLARIGSAFDSLAHTVDVRRIESRRGRFNIPNVGIFLWRLNAYRHTESPAVRVDDRRYLVSPLGHPLQLFTNPQAEDEITHLADPINVPDPIARRALDDRKALYYGTRETPADPVDDADPSIVLYVDGAEVARTAIVACNLADDGAAWAHVPPDGTYGIDPVLGRIALAADLPVPQSVAVTYHDAFSADMGGGEYDRPREADAAGTTVLHVPGDHPTIAAALAALGGSGVVEITDSGRYEETLAVTVNAGGHVILRAAADRRPVLILASELTVTGGADSAFSLEGLLVAGARLRVPGAAGDELARLTIAHATLRAGSRPRWRRQSRLTGRGEPSGRAAGRHGGDRPRDPGRPPAARRDEPHGHGFHHRCQCAGCDRLLRPGRDLGRRRDLPHRLHRDRPDPRRRHGTRLQLPAAGAGRGRRHAAAGLCGAPADGLRPVHLPALRLAHAPALSLPAGECRRRIRRCPPLHLSALRRRRLLPALAQQPRRDPPGCR